MTCTSPIRAFKDSDGVHFNVHSIHNLELPCGVCMECRLRRANDWKIRCIHEASMWQQNCFITLTYARDALPPNASLCKADFQKFMKRLRYHRGAIKIVNPIRYYMCGEYGPLNGRPHYHANIFNCDFRNRTEAGKSESGEPFYIDPELTEIWGHGRATVQNLTPETAGYTAGYIQKKILGKGSEESYNIFDPTTGETIKRIPEYGDMSKKPGIAESWFKKFHTDITRHDVAVMQGREHPVPKYYDKLAIRHGHVDKEELKSKRAQQAASLDPKERTRERRAVRAQVTLARLRNHKRSNEL